MSGPGTRPGTDFALAATLLLAACGNAADMPVAAPGNDIVAGDAEGVVAVDVSPAGDISLLESEAFSADLSRRDGIALGMDSDEVEPLLQAWLDAADADSATLRTSYREDGRTVIVATREGLKDDSVSAEQIYAEFTPVGPLSNRLDFIGLRQRCARGADAGEWTTELCP